MTIVRSDTPNSTRHRIGRWLVLAVLAVLGTARITSAAPLPLWIGDCNAPSFAPAQHYVALSTPTDIATADLNGDVHNDLVVADGGVVLPAQPPAVAVLINNGDGTFQAPVLYPTGGRSGRVVIWDFNADQEFDIFFSTEDATGGVLLGNGDGTFQPLIPNAENNAVDLAVGDFNDDGKWDCAAASGFLFSFVDVLLGNGDGTFQSPIHFDAGGPQSGIVAGDWNFDGSSDLAVTRPSDNALSILINDGAGGFLPHVDYVTGSNPSALAVGSVDSLVLPGPTLPDPQPDLLVANKGRDSVSVFLNLGDGTFQSAGEYPVGHQPVSIATGDFWPSDSRLDLAVVNKGSASVSLLLGHADGTFTPALTVSGVGAIPTSIASGDFDWDGPGTPGTVGFHGYSDLAITDGNSDQVAILLGDCRPVAACSSVTISAGADCQAAASIDAGSSDGDPGDAVTLAQSPPGPYALGQTVVTLTVTDAAGSSSQCEATVTVVDDTPPAIDCPDDIHVTTDPGKCTAQVEFAVTSSDNCETQLVAHPASGSDFPIGSTTVHCSVTDSGGSTATCEFTVTVTVGNHCPRGQGYWKGHPELSPAEAIPMTLGSASYSEAELAHLMSSQILGNASVILAKQLITTILNTAAGSDPQPICAVVGQAQALLGSFAGKLPYAVPTKSAKGQAMLDLADQLESYNKGQLTADCVP